jgi:hypothetical protein
MPVNNLDALREKRKGAIAQGVQIIESRRLPLFTCTESAEDPVIPGSHLYGASVPSSFAVYLRLVGAGQDQVITTHGGAEGRGCRTYRLEVMLS